MAGYTKLHSTILDSSIWAESMATRLVWITMLAMADQNGIVQASVGGLARRANVTREECDEALRVFLGPDPDSRDGTTGERIEKVPGGWLVLNHANYRDKQTREQEQTAARVARHRAKLASVTGNDVTDGNAPKRRTASASLHSGAAAPSERGSAEGDAGFDAFWEAFAYKKAKPNALKAWAKITPDAELLAKIVAAATAYRTSIADKSYQAYPATWLNARRWEDEIIPRSIGGAPRRVFSETHVELPDLGAKYAE
jgi:hypothetical protein